jgi:hypothetical protein
MHERHDAIGHWGPLSERGTRLTGSPDEISSCLQQCAVHRGPAPRSILWQRCSTNAHADNELQAQSNCNGDNEFTIDHAIAKDCLIRIWHQFPLTLADANPTIVPGLQWLELL